jgi:hypothetical protein
MKDEISIAIVGVGGIGSNLASLIVPSLSQGNLSQRFSKININLYDSDKVEEANIFHQRFYHSNISETKVLATKKNLASFENDKLEIIAYEKDVRVRKDIEDNNLIVVCVDSSEARMIVHSTDCIWLDLRCRGDNFMAIDHTVTKSDIDKVTDQNQEPGSCQYEGAVDSGNIQFGFINAASFGCQWIIQNLRTINMEKNVIIPFPRSESITFGTLGEFEKKMEEY